MKKMLLAMAIMMAAVPGVQAQVTHGVTRADMDLTVKPGEDFYEYAGGGWMKANPLSMHPEYSSYGVFNVLAEENENRLRDMFLELGKTDHKFGTVDQKVADLYKMAMDSDRLNREGAQPLMADLAKVKAFKKADLTRFIADQHLTLSNPFFNIGVETDLKNSDMNVMWLSAGTSGLPDRDYYLNTDADSKKIQQAYKDYLVKTFMLAGYSKKEATRACKTIYDIEYKFAQAKMDRAEARDYTKLYNIRTLDQLQADYPAINWKEYFNLMGTPQVEWVILTEPKVMAVANDLMTNLKEQQMRDYMAGLVIRGASNYLSDDFGETSFDFYGRTLSGQKERKPRWKRALGFPNSLLGEAVGEIYVNKYDYSGLQVDPSKSMYENIKAASLYETRRNLDKMGKPVDRDEWGMTPQTVNAYYNPTTNEICFPAAILQPPFFDVEADDATNFGAIGVVIGHEMTHGFDDQGRMFDQYGNMTDWWTEEDSQKFQEAAEKLAEQFDQIIVVKDQHANGHLTLGENIADQGGLRIAFDAFKTTQQFRDGYLSYGRIWADNMTEEAIFQQTKSDPHSIGRYRVNATLRNIDTFFDAFGIKPGEKMWLDPADRAIIW